MDIRNGQPKIYCSDRGRDDMDRRDLVRWVLKSRQPENITTLKYPA